MYNLLTIYGKIEIRNKYVKKMCVILQHIATIYMEKKIEMRNM